MIYQMLIIILTVIMKLQYLKVIFLIFHQRYMNLVLQLVKNVQNMEMKMIINVLNVNQDMNLKMIQKKIIIAINNVFIIIIMIVVIKINMNVLIMIIVHLTIN